ncbi:DNA polymerase III subunit delta [Shewanella surugensis]|uniref:DNA polymerase III subunit delta n=1 Tax=Shewanella surugensis TaxID=212020 RepID=A0ABT0L9I9_9GAMM|nr:DNA polymerase III subunit delta [Shewanella surugensis]MCL1123816.1 DNA polymerase III subunit delta [Shewanella surugensis]
MRVYPDQISKHLTSLKQCYMVFGDDPWLCETTRSLILQKAKKQGFDETIQLTQENNFNWNELLEQWQTLSLFSSRRIIELTLPQAKPGTQGSAMLQSLLKSPNPDILLLIMGPKLALEQTKSKWFKVIDEAGVFIPCPTPEGTQFQRWINDRISHFKLQIESDAQKMLTGLYEGNLLAADQALQLLQLLNPTQPINSHQLEQYFEDQSRFSVFQLIDTLLYNQKKKALHILVQLKAEGVALPIILWSLFKELTILLQLKTAQEDKESLQPHWSQLRIWDKKKPAYQAALSRLKLSHIDNLLIKTSALEMKLKQQGNDDWVGVSHLCLLFDPEAHNHLAHIKM